MQVLLTGSTGLIGRRVTDRLVDADHTVYAVSRRMQDPRHPRVRPVRWRDGTPTNGAPGPHDLDAVIHLAGASIGGKRWSRAYRDEMVHSRVDTTRALRAWLGDAAPAWVQAGAIGYYGRDPEGPCPETRGPGDDFLAALCVAWEAAASKAPGRLVQFRFGHVLDGTDGLLARLLPLYRARIAGVLGSGRQHLPWIHHEDLARLLADAATDPTWAGTYNACSPEVPTYREFHAAMKQALGVTGGPPVPTLALRIAAGGIAPYLTGGQRVVPERLRERGFTWRFTDLDAALEDALQEAQ